MSKLFLPGEVARQRAQLDAISAGMINKGWAATSIVPAQLREEIQLRNNRTNYSFQFPETKQNALPTERTLRRQDIFCAMDIAFYLRRVDSANPNRGALQTFPNPTEFVDANQQLADLEAIYGGNWSFTANAKQYFDRYPALAHRYVPFYNIESNSSVSPIVLTQGQANKSFEFGDGFVPLEPKIWMFGDENNQINFDVPAGTYDWETDASGISYYLVCQLFGIALYGANANNARQLASSLGQR